MYNNICIRDSMSDDELIDENEESIIIKNIKLGGF